MGYFGYVLVIILLTSIPQVLVHLVYKKYLNIQVENKRISKEIGAMILNNVNLYEFKNKSISGSNFNITSIAIAIHEIGHQIQKNRGHLFFRLRSLFSNVTSLMSKTSWIIIYLGFILYFFPFIYFGFFILIIVILFDVITLPLEFNASRRGKEYLLNVNLFTKKEIREINVVLFAKSFTYIAINLAGAIQIVRILFRKKHD